MTHKHTPGPWKMSELAAYVTREHTGEEWSGAEFGEGCDKDEAIANARLIAVAPMMLEALDQLADDMESCGDPQPNTLRAIDAARAAAKGEVQE